jgi:antitoxin MazE
MKSKVRRWGNSLAVRVPKRIAHEVGLRDGGAIEMRLHDGALVIEPVTGEEPTRLTELLDRITAENMHGEVDTGPAEGREIW